MSVPRPRRSKRWRERVARVLVLGHRVRAIVESLIYQTQRARWARVAKAGRPPWDLRNEQIARLIPPGSSVLDLGCGARTLQGLLASGCSYQPCDLIASAPEVIVCDFNAGAYPSLKQRYSHVVCSGVLEYLHDHERFLRACSGYGDVLILSYHPLRPGDTKFARRSNHWINHFSLAELEQTFRKLGLDAECVHTSDQGELLYRIELRFREVAVHA